MTDKPDMIHRTDAVSRLEAARDSDACGCLHCRDGCNTAIAILRALPAAQVADPAQIRADALREAASVAMRLADSAAKRGATHNSMGALDVHNFILAMIDTPPAVLDDVAALVDAATLVSEWDEWAYQVGGVCPDRLVNCMGKLRVALARLGGVK